jgi:vacuolar-type H+-ATPase subunit I/STV1
MRTEIERVIQQSQEDKSTYLIARGHQVDGGVVIAVGRDGNGRRGSTLASPSSTSLPVGSGDDELRQLINDLRREMADLQAQHDKENKELHDKLQSWEDRHGEIKRRADELQALVQHGAQAHVHKGHLHVHSFIQSIIFLSSINESDSNANCLISTNSLVAIVPRAQLCNNTWWIFGLAKRNMKAKHHEVLSILIIMAV